MLDSHERHEPEYEIGQRFHRKADQKSDRDVIKEEQCEFPG
jgi:hypothetical protein